MLGVAQSVKCVVSNDEESESQLELEWKSKAALKKEAIFISFKFRWEFHFSPLQNFCQLRSLTWLKVFLVKTCSMNGAWRCLYVKKALYGNVAKHRKVVCQVLLRYRSLFVSFFGPARGVAPSPRPKKGNKQAPVPQ